MSSPAISVAVLTTPERREYLRDLLRSIERAARVYSGEISVLLVMDRSEAIEFELEGEFEHFSYEVIDSDGWVATGRQRAVEECADECLLFVDDDCRVENELFVRYAERIQESDRAKIGALYGQTFFEGAESTAFRATWGSGIIHMFQAAGANDVLEWAPTANALFDVSAVRDIGGFDTDDPVLVTGEDADIGIRLSEAGYRNITAPESVAYHTTATWEDLWTNLKRTYHSGRAEAWLSQKYPSRTSPDRGRATFLLLFATALVSLPIPAAVPLVIALGLYVSIRHLRQNSASHWRPWDPEVIVAGLYGLAVDVGYISEHISRRPNDITDLWSRFIWIRDATVIQPEITRYGPFER